MLDLETDLQCFGTIIDPKTGESLVTVLTPDQGAFGARVSHFWCDMPDCTGDPTSADWLKACAAHGFAFDQPQDARGPFRPPVQLDKAGLGAQLSTTLTRMRDRHGVDILPDDASTLTSNLLQSQKEADFHNAVKDLVSAGDRAFSGTSRNANKMQTTVSTDLTPDGSQRVIDTCMMTEMDGKDGKSKALCLGVHTNIYTYPDGGFESIVSYFLNERHFVEHIHSKEVTKGWTIGFSIGAGIVAPALKNGTNICIGDPMFSDGERATQDPTSEEPDTSDPDTGTGSDPDTGTGSDPDTGTGSDPDEGGGVIGEGLARSSGLSFTVEFGRTKSKIVRKEFRDFVEKHEVDRVLYLDRRNAAIMEWRLRRGLA